MDTIKGAFLSKTMWLNGFTAIIGALDWAQGHAGIISAVLPQAGPLLIVLGAVNLILRTVTNGSLADKKAA